MKRKTTLVVVIAALFALCFVGCGVKTFSLTPDKDTTYFVYIGLDNAGPETQKLEMDDALKIVKQTLIDAEQGATVLPCWGGFVGDDGVYHENETILAIVNAEETAVSSLAEQWKTDLHINSVYVERYGIKSGIYGGQLK